MIEVSASYSARLNVPADSGETERHSGKVACVGKPDTILAWYAHLSPASSTARNTSIPVGHALTTRIRLEAKAKARELLILGC